MANRWGNNDRLYFLGLQNHDRWFCSHEIKRHLLLGRKAMTNLDSILKNRDITLPAKVHIVKAMVFPVVMYGCESWTIKKAECWRIDAFELRCWRRLLRVPWKARRSNQSILKEISREQSLEGLTQTLKLQYFGHLMWRTDSFEKTLMLGKIEHGRRKGRRGWNGWMLSLTLWIWVWASSGSWWWIGKPRVLQSMGLQRVGHDWATELNWTVSESLRLYRLQPTRVFCPWDFPGKNTGMGCHFLLQGIFPTQESNSHLLHWQANSLPLSHQEALKVERTDSNWGLLPWLECFCLRKGTWPGQSSCQLSCQFRLPTNSTVL